jgi:addiction module RelE/StbE family toxin
MRALVLTPKFQRAYRKAARRDRDFQDRIEEILRQMQVDVFHPALGTHKLSGDLKGLWACSCGYDCRIVFAIEPEAEPGLEVILLLDIGTHEEVY